MNFQAVIVNNRGEAQAIAKRQGNLYYMNHIEKSSYARDTVKNNQDIYE